MELNELMKWRQVEKKSHRWLAKFIYLVSSQASQKKPKKEEKLYIWT